MVGGEILIKNDSVNSKEHTRREKLWFLQFLRGVCCLCIAAAHGVAFAEFAYGVPTGTWDYPFRYSMLQCAYLFLTITGFFLAKEIAAGGNAVIFLKKKFARIFPTYWVGIFFALAIYAIFQHPVPTNSYFWRIFFLLPFDAPYLLNGEWTLIYDVFYYLIGALFLSCEKLRRQFPLFLTAYAAVIITVAAVYLTNYNQLYPYYPLMPLSPAHLSFLVGCAAWYAFNWLKKRKFSIPQWSCWLIEIVAFAVFIFCTRGILTKIDLFTRTISSFVLILVGAQIRIPEKNLLVYIGGYSYGIYLAHATVFRMVFPLYVAAGYTYGVPVYLPAFLCALFSGCLFGRLDIFIGRKARAWFVPDTIRQ